MAEAEKLNVTLREKRGKRNSRRLRQGGSVPAVLYGHGEQNVVLSVQATELKSALRHGAQFVALKGEVNEQALIRDLQWDAFGTEVLHVDFTRVGQHELVEVAVAIRLVGEAPGIREGGVVEHVTHEVSIECPASAIPDQFEVRINDLHLNQTVTLAALDLPEGARLLNDPSTTLVVCHLPIEISEEAAEPTEEAEPEMIGRKADEGEAEGKED